jgi:hypothetical protein
MVIIMKEKNININMNPILAGIPVEFESDEPWRKTRLSCSGAGRVEKNFDRKHLEFMFKFKNQDADEAD